MSAGYLCKSVPLRGDILLGAGGFRNKARAREMARGYKAKGLGQWFLTLLEVLNPTSSIHAFIEPSMRRPTKAQTEKRHKETAAANVTNMCLRPLNGGARVTIISLRPRQS